MDKWMYYMDKKHKIHRAKDFGKWLKNLPNSFHIADTVKGVRVSTVFLNSFVPVVVTRRPYLFQTAIFKGRKIIIVARYKTVQEAKRGHTDIILKLLKEKKTAGRKRK